MQYSKYAFTMIEMIFVIVVLGILASVAIPKLAATRTDAQVTKARADIASIRSAIISERQSRLIKGDSSWLSSISSSTTSLFGGPDSNHTLLMYPIAAQDADGHWQSTSGTAYTYKVGGSTCAFTYSSSDGTFNLTTSGVDICNDLVD